MTPLQVLIAVMVLLTFSALSADEQINPTAPQAPRPNIVWLVSEDHSVHYLKLFSEHGAETPHIELLAEHGLTFNHAFSNASVCSVARTTLATGCYGPRIGTQFHRRSVEVPMPDGLKMFPEYLIEAGYYTANNNKTDYNATAGKNLWNDSSKKATWRNRKADQPFFYMQSFPASHESSLHFTAKQMASEKTLHDPDQVFVAPYHPDTPTFRYTYARYLDRMKQMDEQVGAVVEELTKDGLLEDTFIFYFGDLSGVLPRGKGYAYESGLHVPLVVRIPEKWRHMIDREPGSRVNGFVSFIDLGPTALNLAGVAVPTLMDGKPFLAQVSNMQKLILATKHLATRIALLKSTTSSGLCERGGMNMFATFSRSTSMVYRTTIATRYLRIRNGEPCMRQEDLMLCNNSSLKLDQQNSCSTSTWIRTKPKTLRTTHSLPTRSSTCVIDLPVA